MYVLRLAKSRFRYMNGRNLVVDISEELEEHTLSCWVIWVYWSGWYWRCMSFMLRIGWKLVLYLDTTYYMLQLVTGTVKVNTSSLGTQRAENLFTLKLAGSMAGWWWEVVALHDDGEYILRTFVEWFCSLGTCLYIYLCIYMFSDLFIGIVN